MRKKRCVRGTSVNDNSSKSVVLVLEVNEECRYARHHQHKIALFLSAMRHFAQNLPERCLQVDYVQLDDPENMGNRTSEVQRAQARHQARRLVLTEPGKWRVQAMAASWSQRLYVPVDIRPDDRFIASRERFQPWANGRRSSPIKNFYREICREHQILLDGDQPDGGVWYLDKENRKSLQGASSPPGRLRFEPDPTTRGVVAIVAQRFSKHFSTVATSCWPVVRSQAFAALLDFITNALPWFGDYEDATKAGETFLYQTPLAPSLNLDLLSPREVRAAAEDAWRTVRAPISATEGFIRQILAGRNTSAEPIGR
ncbi:cryptochrome/photolyase family protein [Alphaproteobacteria bacterium]|nr:cryptochrome/photolyase family protein [Alphaproteobacteria bacterium]